MIKFSTYVPQEPGLALWCSQDHKVCYQKLTRTSYSFIYSFNMYLLRGHYGLWVIVRQHRLSFHPKSGAAVSGKQNQHTKNGCLFVPESCRVSCVWRNFHLLFTHWTDETVIAYISIAFYCWKSIFFYIHDSFIPFDKFSNRTPLAPFHKCTN